VKEGVYWRDEFVREGVGGGCGGIESEGGAASGCC